MRVLIFFLMGLASCSATQVVPEPSNFTEYFRGTSVTTSPDGKQAYGPELIIFETRTFQKNGKLLIEDATHPSADYKTTLMLEGNRFSVSNESFDGEIVFEGSRFDWDTWTFEVNMKDGSRVRGTGQKIENGFRTEGILSKKEKDSFFPSAKIVQVFKRIDKEAYDKGRRQHLESRESKRIEKQRPKTDEQRGSD